MKSGSGTVRYAARWRLLKRSIWIGALLLAIVFVYAYIASAGRLERSWPIYMDYYDLLAEGFRGGHLYVPLPPSPQLVAQKNPADPVWGNLWMVDLSLYGDHYYLYWGPLPAALQAIAKAALGIYRMIGDQYLVFSFIAVCALFGALFIEHLARGLFPTAPLTLIVASILAFAFTNPLPHLVATGGTYQAAIAGGQTFLLGGLFFAFIAVWNDQFGHVKHRWLISAGAFWAFALACRISLAPAVACFAFFTVFFSAWPLKYRWKNGLFSGFWIGTPLTVGIASLLIYNKIRFDRWLDFGINEQLSWFPYKASTIYLRANLYSYILRPFDWSCQFPYVHQVVNMGTRALPDWLETPAGYLAYEPLVGWLPASPITWLSPIALVAALRTIPKLFKRRADKYAETRSRRAYLWCTVCFAIYGSVTGAAVLLTYTATMRYLVDVIYGLTLLGILGGFTLYSRSKTIFARRLVEAMFIALSTGTIIIGLLLGYQGYNRHFHIFNPELDAKLTNALSFCDDRK